MSQERKTSKLLLDVNYASAFATPASAADLARGKSDVAMWHNDGLIAETLYASASVSRLTWRDGLLAEVLKFISKFRQREIKAQISAIERRASVARRSLRRSLLSCYIIGKPATQWFDERTPNSEWPTRFDGRPLTPLEISNSATAKQAVMLTPYQLQAAGLIEFIRASGDALRVDERDGDYLADVFSSMILAFADIPVAKANLETGDLDIIEPLDSPASWLEYDFNNLVSGASITPEAKRSLADWKRSLWVDGMYLPGSYQHLAITVLASWMRMCRLGVRLSSRERLANWRVFFDGIHYGSDPALLGEAWRMSDKDIRSSISRYTLNERWRKSSSAYWADASSGVPNVFVGLVADTLHTTIQSLSTPTADTETSEISSMRDNRFPKEQIQLEQHYRELASSVPGSIRGLRLVDSY